MCEAVLCSKLSREYRNTGCCCVKCKHWHPTSCLILLYSVEREVWNLAPYITRDFAIRGLADRIKDLKNLVKLYPDVPKDNAFAKYYTSPQGTPVGYNCCFWWVGGWGVVIGDTPKDNAFAKYYTSPQGTPAGSNCCFG